MADVLKFSEEQNQGRWIRDEGLTGEEAGAGVAGRGGGGREGWSDPATGRLEGSPDGCPA